jgi:hypothetical protein
MQYYRPPENTKRYELDFAIPAKKIAFEINGNQHYDGANLAPYYQARHDYFNRLGWTIYEIHYYESLNMERALEVIEQCLADVSIEYSSNPKIISHKDIRKNEKVIATENKTLARLKVLDVAVQNKFLDLLNDEPDNKYEIYQQILSVRPPSWNKNKDFLAIRKVLRPSKEELQKMLWEKPTLHLAKDLGVSDKAIEKWAKKYGCTKPPRGYWEKLFKPTFGRKICVVCDTEYICNHISQLYCSSKCREKYSWLRKKAKNKLRREAK